MKTEAEQEEINALRRELIGTQEMLAFVLKAVGKPVEVSKEAIHAGLGASAQIQVDDDIEGNKFIFSIIGDE